jgi:ABC-type nitrate/sulfonate/bicarbonate transport system ATPase subunit
MKLTVEAVSKAFRDNGTTTLALADLSFGVEAGEFVTLIGPSGCGKSTAFNLITGLTAPDRGEIRLNERLINGQPGVVAYMPQRDLLLPWRTILDNVILGAEIVGEPRTVARRHALDLFSLFGLTGFENVYPSALSGGMRQRAALLRTFLLGKDTLLLDEPFGALDALTRYDLQSWLLDVWERFSTTILFITHDVREAVLLSDRVLVFTPRPGRIKSEMRIVLPRPRDDSSADFIRHQAALLKLLRNDG